MPFRKLVIVLFLLLTLGGQVPVRAQTPTGTILGTVTDETGARLRGVPVTVRNRATNVKRKTVSDSLGEYIVFSLQPGEYEVWAEMPGFTSYLRSGISLQVGERARVDLELSPGETTFSVTVSADAPMVEADNAALGAVVDEHKMIELPLNGRDFFQLADLVPGVVPGAEGSQNLTQGGAISVNGMRDQSNNFLLDGVDNNDQAINHVVVPPPVDGVQEFRVQSGIYAPEFGSRSGAQLNFVTRSGTNHLRLSLYEFHRNAALDAKNFFDPPELEIPKFVRNQFGFSAGGPIRRDQTFFFGNYESLQERKAITRLATVPPADFVRGDFSSLPFMIINPVTGAPWEGNIIPPSAQHPVGAAIANFFPAANSTQPGGNLLSQPVRRNEIHQFLVRIDHQIGEKDSLFGRYAFFDEDRFNPFDPFFGVTNIPGYGSFNLNRGQNAVLSWLHTFGLNTLNDFRIGFNRSRAAILQENIGRDLSSQLGVSGLSTQPLDVGFPFTQVVGFDPLAEPANLPQKRVTNTYHLTDGFSWHKQRHSFKMGVDIRQIRLNFFLNFLSRGQFIYTGALTNHPVADLLLGIPTLALGTSGDTFSNVLTSSYNFYFQDDFRVTPTLSLNYGLRYEYNKPPIEVRDRFTRPDLSSPAARFIQCGTEGIPRSCQENDRNNLAPRFGFAWSPSGIRFVVRGGYGIFYDTGILNYSILSRFNPPNFGIRLFTLPVHLIDIAAPFTGNPFPLALVTTIDRRFPQAYAQQWSFNLQYGLGNHHLIQLGYVGSKGTQLVGQRNLNQPRPGQAPPFPTYGPIAISGPDATSNYHALQVRAERRFVDGFSFLASYTWSKSIDSSSSWLGSTASGAIPQDSLNRAAERGLSDFDTRQRFVLSSIWELPSFSASPPAVRALIGDWQLSGILTFQSSRPFTPFYLGTNDSQTDNSGTAFGTGTDRPNLVADPHFDNPDPAGWVSTAAFERPSGSFGDAGRNILRGPGFSSVDLALMKQWRFRERSRVQFRAEFFNLFNTPNFNLPVGDLNNPSFGRVTSAKDSRQIQIGLRLDF